MDTLLYWPSPGRNFFEVWRLNPPLQSTLGYPVARTYGTIPGAPDTLELPFQRGAMQIQVGPPLCYRIFDSNELAIRAAAGCQLMTKCPKAKRTPEAKQKDWQPGDDDPPPGPDPETVSSATPPRALCGTTTNILLPIEMPQ